MKKQPWQLLRICNFSSQLEVKLLSNEAELEQQLNENEKDIFLKSGSLKTLPESENAMYNSLIIKLKYKRFSRRILA